MPKKVEERLHILSPHRGYISPAKIMGPIVHPLNVSKSVAVQILMTGAKLYEYIPETKGTIELTLENINNPNRCDKHDIPAVAVPVEPVKKPGVTVTPEANPEKEEVAEAPETPEDVVPETSEQVTEPAEAEAVVEEAPKANVVETISFTYKEDGTIDDSTIEWNSYSKNDRKAIRAYITQYNEALVNNQ